MAEEIEIVEDFNFEANQVASRTLDRKFGREEDYAELHVLTITDQIVNTNFDFTNFTTPPESIDGDGLASEINMDPVKELNNIGYISGKYKLKLNLLRRKILNSSLLLFNLKEISSSRTELKLNINSSFNNKETIASIRNFINEVESNVFFKDFGLNFNTGTVITAINIALDERGSQPQLLIKLLNPLSPDFNLNDQCNIVEEVVDPTILTINLGRPSDEDDSIPLQGPNFKIDVRLNSSIPSRYKTFDDILNSSTVLSSSYSELLSSLEEDDVLNIDYTFLRTVSGSDMGDPVEEVYHFENFVHFGSAVERLKNFEYKLKLIELYDKDISAIKSITGTTANSSFTITAKNDIVNKKDKLIQGFDGYEKFLYFTSGSVFTWPKQNTTKPYALYSVTSSQAKAWLGDERSSYDTYGGQLLSASLFDRQNQNNLERIIPNHVLDNEENERYRLFANMIGQHFDNIWTHIKHITEIPDTHHTRGISRDLVYVALKSLGVEAFDQFENSNLIEYILGEGSEGSAFYDVPAQQTLVTASNEGSLPKQDLSKTVWKRLYHNAPYLLKTKGTERGIKALMSCYGIPSTILNVKEYGGPVKDKTGYKTFTYDKSGLALELDNSDPGLRFGVKTDWSSSLLDVISASAKTVEFRMKPYRNPDGRNYTLFGFSGSFTGSMFTSSLPVASISPHLVLNTYTGNDISSSNDANQYGKLELFVGGVSTGVSTSNFPIYNGKFWNIFISNKAPSNPTGSSNIEFGAYQANFNKHIHKYTNVGSFSQTQQQRALTFGDPFSASGQFVGGAQTVIIGGIPNHGSLKPPFDQHASGQPFGANGHTYSGSLQEVRYYFGKNRLTHDTFVKHALEPFMYAGNDYSSSFTDVVFRLPLGSNDKRDITSFHPNIDVKYIPDSSIQVNISGNSTHNLIWKEEIEDHFHPTPDTVGASMTSEKVRIDEGVIDDDILSLRVKSEISTLDRQPQDFEDLGVFFSPTTELNEDIVYQLGAFRLDDFIGSPLISDQTGSVYADLIPLRKEYFKRVKRRYNYWDYVKLIQYIDHTLFKMVEQFVPAKANLKTGLLVEPHYLERAKFPRELPELTEGQTMTPGSYNTLDFQLDPEKAFTLEGTLGGGNVVTTNNLLRTTGSNGQRQEQGTNFTIDIDDYILDEKQEVAQAPIIPNNTGSNQFKRISNTLLGNATRAKKSRIYVDSTAVRNNYPTDLQI